MEIGNWKATAELCQIYRDARELGIETNLAELEAFGFTIVEPEKLAPRAFTKRMLEATLEAAEREDPMAVDLGTRAQKDRPVYGRNLFHMIDKDDVFAEALLNPTALTIGKFLVGASCRLFSSVAFVKNGPAGVTRLHSDSVGTPPPLPFYGTVCNLSWILTDYTQEKGTFFIVPGSHRICRHPVATDQPKIMDGPGDDDIGVPIIAKAGSLLAFHGNTWHGTYPKKDDEVRVHVVTALARNFVEPSEDFSDIAQEKVDKFGPEFARLISRTAWQGYKSEGPKYDRMLAVNRAQQSSMA
jgi:ectoine hydroxylase-related dioxygenase (phytanoyl-CoA dioxygenase family)